jgi:hypothetical protein
MTLLHWGEHIVNITLKVIKENKDGSADAVVNFDKEGLEFLIQEGILSILKQYIEQQKKEKKRERTVGKSKQSK